MLHVKPRDCREREVSVVLCLSRVFYLGLALITMPPKNKRQKQSESALAIGREKLVRLMSGSSDHNVSNQQDVSPASTSNTANVELGVADLLSPTDAPDDDDETVDPTFDMDGAAELAGMMVGRSERTIHDWESRFVANGFILPDSKQGQYQRSGVLWKDEELNRKATEHIRSNNVVKGRPN